MERLTGRELNSLGGVHYSKCHQENCHGNCADCEITYEAELKLKAYEDAEEQGLLLRLPCKVGDIVYAFDYPRSDIVVVVDEEVEKIHIREEKIVIETDGGFYRTKDFGRIIFLTKEEALAKMKEV
jgi:hypothetical protein